MLEETFQLTMRQRIYEDDQSCMADIAVQCETLRQNNSNYRLDLEPN